MKTEKYSCIYMSFRGARSSVVEHHVDIVGVVGSIPTVPTKKVLSFLNIDIKAVEV